MKRAWLIPAGLILALTGAGGAAAQQITIDNSTSHVTALGSNLTPAAGQSSCTMSPSLAAAVATAYPNGGLSVSGFDGATCTGNVIPTPAPPTPTPLPTSTTLLPGANAGAGATVTTVPGAQSDRFSGALRVTTGAVPTAGAMIVVTYPQAFSRPARVFLQPINSAASGILDWYPSGQTATGVTINIANPPTPATAYDVEYEVVP